MRIQKFIVNALRKMFRRGETQESPSERTKENEQIIKIIFRNPALRSLTLEELAILKENGEVHNSLSSGLPLYVITKSILEYADYLQFDFVIRMIQWEEIYSDRDPSGRDNLISYLEAHPDCRAIPYLKELLVRVENIDYSGCDCDIPTDYFRGRDRERIEKAIDFLEDMAMAANFLD